MNFSVYCAHKTTPPALRAIANDPETAIDGFILPGHVATITGLAPFSFLVDEFNTPGVVTGFEPVDILQGICMLVQMVVEGRPAIDTPTAAASMQTATPWRASWSSRCLSHATLRGAGWGRLQLGPFHPPQVLTL